MTRFLNHVRDQRHDAGEYLTGAYLWEETVGAQLFSLFLLSNQLLQFFINQLEKDIEGVHVDVCL